MKTQVHDELYKLVSGFLDNDSQILAKQGISKLTIETAQELLIRLKTAFDGLQSVIKEVDHLTKNKYDK